jgi:hypothetical protein
MAYAMFSDATLETVVGVFSCEQDEQTFPNVSEIPDTDDRLIAYYRTLPVIVQKMLPPDIQSLLAQPAK